MAVETVTRWRVQVQYSRNIDVYVDRYGVIVEQDETKMVFGKSSADDLCEAIKLAAASLPDDADSVPF